MAEPKLQRYWELEWDGEQITDVQGQLKAHKKFWEDVHKVQNAFLRIQTSPFINTASICQGKPEVSPSK